MIVYVDTSALIKRYVLESGSSEVNALLAQAETCGTVALTLVEMASALAKATRMDWVEIGAAQAAWQDFRSHWPTFVRLKLTHPLIERASRLTWDYGLRAYDATHLATALFWQETLETPVILATYDRELWLAGQKVGMAVWPENPRLAC
ncbi:MAG: PIN domain-containing protein [Candidatus Viridilinea halotolerans]|uniref:PIN domain-containing protein n=1 Tax=Candidatus Viridilinea halotolerans TaxID=2491704 RepID=A0A426U0N2_9CHLR|nr:MAG: PIN domain-containing protein [Candidatus Viridilinea halotolerans]